MIVAAKGSLGRETGSLCQAVLLLQLHSVRTFYLTRSSLLKDTAGEKGYSVFTKSTTHANIISFFWDDPHCCSGILSAGFVLQAHIYFLSVSVSITDLSHASFSHGAPAFCQVTNYIIKLW
ncbi:uncharacterized protein EV420DRAFT_11898 [Desarmillaria tabescens]|uniref:Uncharacterized protein n=1 Tax=Armillaria tabescens TaxID=1929756 RepID=A0AA39NP07_ARMTA|nr:uncharacterized protein EV420DRAFT_11898 [Desarmillaria tabescens]KAK0469180.1 hypothetical protein EV420DRAFT_11898 [Desarmillaria tabescens]